jgi:hypothetical protein
MDKISLTKTLFDQNNVPLIVLRIFKLCFRNKTFFTFQNGENLRQQTYSQFSQSEAFLCLGLFDKTFYK